MAHSFVIVTDVGDVSAVIPGMSVVLVSDVSAVIPGMSVVLVGSNADDSNGSTTNIDDSMNLW